MKTILFALIFATSYAHARLGETVGQCVDRYGAILNTSGEMRWFRKSGFEILITFHEGKADAISYRKEPTGTNGETEKFSENEIEALLRKNAASVWKRRAASANREWETEGGLRATYYVAENFLLVFTAGAEQRNAIATKAAEDKRIKGL